MTATIAGQPITMTGGRLDVPNTPTIPFIEGDGTGRDIWRASQRVLDAAVEKAYGSDRQTRLARGPRRAEGVRRRPASGCPTPPSTPSAPTWLASKARSPRPPAAAFDRSMSRCGKFSISTPACGPSAGLKVCRRLSCGLI